MRRLALVLLCYHVGAQMSIEVPGGFGTIVSRDGEEPADEVERFAQITRAATGHVFTKNELQSFVDAFCNEVTCKKTSLGDDISLELGGIGTINVIPGQAPIEAIDEFLVLAKAQGVDGLSPDNVNQVINHLCASKVCVSTTPAPLEVPIQGMGTVSIAFGEEVADGIERFAYQVRKAGLPLNLEGVSQIAARLCSFKTCHRPVNLPPVSLSIQGMGSIEVGFGEEPCDMIEQFSSKRNENGFNYLTQSEVNTMMTKLCEMTTCTKQCEPVSLNINDGSGSGGSIMVRIGEEPADAARHYLSQVISNGILSNTDMNSQNIPEKIMSMLCQLKPCHKGLDMTPSSLTVDNIGSIVIPLGGNPTAYVEETIPSQENENKVHHYYNRTTYVCHYPRVGLRSCLKKVYQQGCHHNHTAYVIDDHGEGTGGPLSLRQLAIAFAMAFPGQSYLTDNRIRQPLLPPLPQGVKMISRNELCPGDVYIVPEVNYDCNKTRLGIHVGVRMYMWQLGTRSIRNDCSYIHHNHFLASEYINGFPRERILTPYIAPLFIKNALKWTIGRDQSQSDGDISVLTSPLRSIKRNLILVDNDVPSQLIHEMKEIVLSLSSSLYRDQVGEVEIELVVLRDYNQLELIELYKEAKVVFDWCMRGSERVPLEASLFGAVLLTNNCESGSDFSDFPIPSKYKFNHENIRTSNDDFSNSLIDFKKWFRDTLQDVLINYWIRLSDFAPLRWRVLSVNNASLVNEVKQFVQFEATRTRVIDEFYDADSGLKVEAVFHLQDLLLINNNLDPQGNLNDNDRDLPLEMIELHY